MSDNPELEAFKAKVFEVAKVYAERHDMCEVVDQALEEMGLGPAYVSFEYTLALPIVVRVEARMTSLSTLSEEERQTHILGTLSATSPYVSSGEGHSVSVTPGALIQYEGTITTDGAPTGYVRGYVDNDGRAAHYFPSGGGYSLCGRMYASVPMSNSFRASGTVCIRCAGLAERK